MSVDVITLSQKQNTICAVEIPPSSPALNKAKIISSGEEVMTAAFWDAEETVFIYYFQKLCQLTESVTKMFSKPNNEGN